MIVNSQISCFSLYQKVVHTQGKHAAPQTRRMPKATTTPVLDLPEEVLLQVCVQVSFDEQQPLRLKNKIYCVLGFLD
jgi:hypothetical protein